MRVAAVLGGAQCALLAAAHGGHCRAEAEAGAERRRIARVRQQLAGAVHDPGKGALGQAGGNQYPELCRADPHAGKTLRRISGSAGRLDHRHDPAAVGIRLHLADPEAGTGCLRRHLGLRATGQSLDARHVAGAGDAPLRIGHDVAAVGRLQRGKRAEGLVAIPPARAGNGRMARRGGEQAFRNVEKAFRVGGGEAGKPPGDGHGLVEVVLQVVMGVPGKQPQQGQQRRRDQQPQFEKQGLAVRACNR